MFSHPVYLFLREFSLQDFRGGSLHMLCVKLQLKMSCSGGNFLVNSVLVDTNMDTSLLDTTQSQIVTMLNLKQRSLYAPYQIKRSHAQNGLQENGNLLMG
ncbi:hypothetical protein [Escherichia coli]|uniref:hypothetical protein n=1 Tax=Escherichia coli TaxID=562 RepID=UPI00201AFAD1|nr:hypothetical protein [Escherichia coli]